jgi:hypothetical protein
MDASEDGDNKLQLYFFHESNCKKSVRVVDVESQKRTLHPLVHTNQLASGTEYLDPLCEVLTWNNGNPFVLEFNS